MPKTLSGKHRKIRRNKASAYKAGEAPAKHKIDEKRSKKARKKNANRAK